MTKFSRKLVLHCLSLEENGVGTAWGLPVIRDGGAELSALGVSRGLKPLRDSLGAAELAELEKIGVGPLGRYTGGERIQPVPLGPKAFFARQKGELPVETGDLYWKVSGNAAAIFRDHCEFLRTWGFSGGVTAAAALKQELGRLLGTYLVGVRDKAPGAKILLILPERDFEDAAAALPRLKSFGDTAAGDIPLNFLNGGEPVLDASFRGLGAAVYEKILPNPQAKKYRCDILALFDTTPPPGMDARLTLTVSFCTPAEKSGGAQKLSVNDYLVRYLGNGRTAPPALPFPRPQPPNPAGRCGQRGFSGGMEEAAALDLLPLWDSGRVEAAAGALFGVTAKFAGINAAGLKEEQAWFYRDTLPGGQTNAGTANAANLQEAPPVRPGASFMELNDTQRAFFVAWRKACRRGSPPELPEGCGGYIRLYAGELALCMGREGPMHHFLALRDLFHVCRKNLPESALLCRWLLDFAAIYGIASDALPLLVDELWNDPLWPEKFRPFLEDPVRLLLIDVSLYRLFVKEEGRGETLQAALVHLVPEKIFHRKGGEDPLGPYYQAFTTIDAQLRRDWRRGFFDLFYPPRPVNAVFTAFEKLKNSGRSSYTVFWPGFSSHKPLLEALSALARDDTINPLSGSPLSPRPLSLKEELLEELRLESDAVREILTVDTSGGLFSGASSGGIRHRPFLPAPEDSPGGSTVLKDGADGPAYTSPGRAALEEFVLSLGKQEQSALRAIAAGPRPQDRALINDMIIDVINTAFNDRFGDLLIETGEAGPSIIAEYGAILHLWE